MATATYEEADDRGTTSSRRSGGASRGSTSSRGAASAINPAALYEIVERLGVVDMVIDRVRNRLEEADLDEILDQSADYLKRNPEVVVVMLGAITLAAGALVYMNKRNEPSSRTSGSSSGSTGGSSSSGSSKSRSRSSSSR